MVNFTSKSKTSKILQMLKLEKGEKSFTGRKIIFFASLLWLPMLFLSVYESSALNPTLAIPFLMDYAVYARFLIALPMIFIAERSIRLQNINTIEYFINSGIIAENNIDKFQRLLNRVIQAGESVYTEIITLVMAYLMVILFWSNFDIGLYGTTWSFVPGSDNIFSLAGYWYYYFAIPIYQFLFFRMFFRYLLWAIFMWRISRMKLNLYPTNPDLSAGLGFLGVSLLGFSLLGFAQSSVLSGEMANRIAYMGEIIWNNIYVIISSAVGAAFLYFFPAFFFVKKLYHLKLKGLLEYGVITSRQSNAFYEKWIVGTKREPNEFLETGDFSSLTDMNTSYDIIQKMRLVPLEIRKVLFMVLIILAPYTMLFLISYPIQEIFEFLLKFIM